MKAAKLLNFLFQSTHHNGECSFRLLHTICAQGTGTSSDLGCCFVVFSFWLTNELSTCPDHMK